MGQIRWSIEAYDWLKNVRDYIAKDKPVIAQKLAKGIIEKINLLREFPEIGYRLSTAAGKQVRVLLYGHYRIVYQINPDKDINLLGIFHGALDLKKHLKPD